MDGIIVVFLKLSLFYNSENGSMDRGVNILYTRRELEK